jgi:predicted amidohydrolase|tara:strand:- start:1456 stop:2238 length:783 start_codon:yes stop_codon:yes gene_type:complete
MQTLTLTLLQTATYWHSPARNRTHFETLLDQVPSSSQLVVLPEMFSTGFTMDSALVAESMDGETVKWMLEQARERQKILCGSLAIEEKGQFFNRLLWVQPKGGIQFYDKRHLFRMAGEHRYYSEGARRIVVDLQGWRICLSVCYDLRFPVWLRNNQKYDLLICVANWPEARQDIWQTLLRARAVENQAFCAGVNIVGTDGAGIVYGGGSGIYHGDGKVLVDPEENLSKQKIITQTLDLAELDTMRRAFPVALDADEFILE